MAIIQPNTKTYVFASWADIRKRLGVRLPESNAKSAAEVIALRRLAVELQQQKISVAQKPAKPTKPGRSFVK